MWFLEGGRQANTRQLPPRPLYMPALPDQLSESAKGSVICPVPRCTGRFTNHDSLCYHCMLEHFAVFKFVLLLGRKSQYYLLMKKVLQEWLYERCEDTCTSFSTKTSMCSGYAMYRCNRAGAFRTWGIVRIGSTSKKSQSHCTAFLRVGFTFVIFVVPGYLRIPGKVTRSEFYNMQDEMEIVKQQPMPRIKVGRLSCVVNASKRIEYEKCWNPHSRLEDGLHSMK
uniref:C2H2-type domain-containing protein n=1 Tax=Angiostrongylus cantonensis TaxID=6313 RepID=A0A0K0D0K8_ANGCA